MTNEVDYIELIIQPASHEGFMDCINTIGLDVEIRNGMYLVFYDEPEELYRLGLLVARVNSNDFLSVKCSLPVNLNTKAPTPRKRRK